MRRVQKKRNFLSTDIQKREGAEFISALIFHQKTRFPFWKSRLFLFYAKPQASNACVRSAMRSSALSRPMLKRKKPLRKISG